jgi:hypothetical protein
MIRCPWCGAPNYAIDSWCSRCSRHLDFKPAAPTPRPPSPPPQRARPQTGGRRSWLVLAPAAAAIGVAIALALPVANWFSAAGPAPRPALPQTALAPLAPTAVATATATAVAAPTPDINPTPDSSPPAEPVPTAGPAPGGDQGETGQALVPTGGDPAAAVTRFYQAVSAHDFQAAAALWTSRLQAQYPPARFIDQRFAGTQQINLEAEQVLGDNGGTATVYVKLVEVIDGQTRHWLGTWQLVDTSAGWLLNRPNLRAAS